MLEERNTTDEKRVSSRTDFALTLCDYQLLEMDSDVSEAQASGQLRVLDVSTSGCRIAFDGEPSSGWKLRFKLPAGQVPRDVWLQGRLIWVSRKSYETHSYQAGMEFDHLHSDDLDAIKQIVAFIDLHQVDNAPGLRQIIPLGVCRRYQMAPFLHNEEDKLITVAAAAWVADETLNELKQSTGCDIKFHYAPLRDVHGLIQLIHGRREAGDDGEGQVPVAMFDQILEGGLDLGASDLHLQPGEPSQVRYRVDGLLQLGPVLSPQVSAVITSRIKVLAGMDIAETRDAQDGQFNWSSAEGKAVDVRVATMPTIAGEHVSLRLFYPQSGPEVVEELGFLPTQLEMFRSALSIPHGLILFTGPTGAGKTTSLYAALKEVNRLDRHVVTVEDPVEQIFPSITQIEIHGQSRLATDNILGSVLRHDPDVLMIGEIRDEASLEAAIKGALTGHLVLASLHATDAVSAVTRLIDMGTPPYLVASTLSMVINQRLLRRLCVECKIETTLSENDAKILGVEPGIPVFIPGWCDTCFNTGYLGRSAIYEILSVNPALRDAVARGSSSHQLRQLAMEDGMESMERVAAKMVTNGSTDTIEVMRVLGNRMLTAKEE